MKCLAVLCGLLAVASATPGAISYHYANPGGVTYRGTGLGSGFQPLQPQLPQYQQQYQPQYQQSYLQNPNNFQIGVAQPVAAAPALAAAPLQQYAAAPVHQYAAAPVQYAQQVYQPAVAVHQKVGYANQQVLTSVPGVANVPVTKLALTQGVTQKLVDVAQPAVKNRRVKVRRPALRKEFYDIEHRIIVRPAGSATLELSQPISKEQKGPAVITPTDIQQIAPVVRYGTARQIIDGPGVSQLAQNQVALARGAFPPAGPAPQPQGPPPQPDFRSQQPQGPPPQQPQGPPPAPRRPLQLRPQGPPPQPQGPPPQQPQFRNDDAIEINADGQQQQQQQQFQQQQQQQREQFQQQQQQQQQQFQQQQQQFQQQQQQQPQGPPPQPQGPPPQPQQPRPQPLPAAPIQGRALLASDMPIELQGRLVELLSAKGGTVTEVLNENGSPANQASVLQVADALQDVSLQGGERITTRRIVVTRPIETVQEVDIQEPATKIHRVAVNTPTLFKTPVQGIAQVPVNVAAVKNIATPVVKTHLAPAYGAYAQPAYGAYAQQAYGAY